MNLWEPIFSGIDRSFETVLHVSWQAGVLALMIVGAQKVLGKRISARWRYALWWLLVVRLLMPVIPSAPWSVFNIAPKAPEVSLAAPVISTPSLDVDETLPLPASSEPVTVVPVSDLIPFAATNPTMVATPDTPVATSALPSAIDHWKWSNALALIWLIVGSFMLLRLLMAEWALARVLRRESGPEDQRLDDILRECSTRLRLRRRVRLVETDRVDRPAVSGLFTPMLLLPTGFADQFSRSELCHVFLHELAHVKRRDLEVQFAANLFQALHWFNPLLWWAFSRMRADRELAADELALVAAGDEAGVSYGETILRVLKDLSSSRRNPRVVGIAEGKEQLKARLQGIVEFGRVRHWRAVAPACLVVIACVALTDAQSPSSTDVGQGRSEQGNAKPSLTLVVTNEDSGDPLASATGRIVLTHYDGRVEEFAWASDEAGHFQLSTDLRGLKSLEYRAEHSDIFGMEGKWEHQELERLPERLVLAIPSGVDIGGRVVDATGQPIADAVVVTGRATRLITSGGFYPIESHVLSIPSGIEVATTDGDGRWRARWAGSSIHLRIRHPEYADGVFSTDYTKEMERTGVGSSIRFDALKGLDAEQVLEPGVTLAGRVVNDLGETLPGVVVHYTDEKSDHSSGPVVDRTRQVTTDDQGRFELPYLRAHPYYFSTRPPGYAPAVAEWDPEAGNRRVELVVNRGRSLTGQVVDQSDRPIANVSLEMVDWSVWQGVRWVGKTDSEGRFKWDHAPSERFRLRLFKPGYLVGRPVVSTDLEQTLRLKEPLVLSGNVVDAATGLPVESFRLRWKSSSHRDAWEASVIEGQNGQYRIDVGRLRADGWVGGYAHEFVLRVEADGYQAKASRSFRSGEGDVGAQTLDFSLDPVERLVGQVIGPTGQPVSDVQVTLRAPGSRLHLKGAPHFENPANEVLVVTDDEGRFNLNPDPEAFAIVAVHKLGIAWLKEWDPAKPIVLHLQPWGRVEGVVLEYGKPVPESEVHGGVRIFHMPPSRSRPPVIALSRAIGATDSNGRFVFEYLPPGRHWFYRMIKRHNGASSGTKEVVHLEPGDTAEIQIGGFGRRVVGRFVVENPYVAIDWLGDPDSTWAQTVLPDPPKDANTPEAIQAWRRRPEIAKQIDSSRSYPLIMSEDGTFRMDEVLPGEYRFTLRIYDPRRSDSFSHGRYIATMSHRFEINGAEPGSGTDPIDLGVIPVRLKADIQEGQTEAPTFRVPSAREGTIDLADHKGKFVLLDFWATWCAPCLADMPYLRAVHNRYADRSDFVVIGLSLDEQMENVHRFLQKNDAPWLQGYLGPRDNSPLPSQYGAEGIPATFLIDPAGKIVGKGLRGKRIEIEVAKHLNAVQLN